MQNELGVRHQIRQALEPAVTPAPWLTANIRSSLRGDTFTPRRRGLRLAPRAWSTARTAAAIVLLIALVAALIVGSRALNRPQTVPADRVLTQYRSAVHQGWDKLHRSGDSGIVHCRTDPVPGQPPRPDLCRADSVQMKADAQSFLDLLAGVDIPPALQGWDSDLKQALRDIQAALDERVAQIDAGRFDETAGLNDHINSLKIDGVYQAVTAIDCWPREVRPGADSWASAYECNS